MLQIKNTLVSLDLVEICFMCDLDACLGQCCVEGDAGAPLADGEKEMLEEALPVVRPYLSPAALREIDANGVAYHDADGDLVTSIVDGRDCVFTTYAPGGKCLCAIEKAYRDGVLADNCKPISCSLYPVRLKQYAGFTAVNLHHWKVCKAAEVLGRMKRVPAYLFLREPLTRCFGKEWFDELHLTATEYMKSKSR